MALDAVLLNASFEPDPTSRNFERELDAPLTEFVVTDGELPDRYTFDAAVITGSRASVYWEEDWIAGLKGWTGEAIDRGVPVLGVCFGAQLLADVLGGQVEGKGQRELGYHTIRHAGDDLLFEDIDDEFVAFTSHGDDIVELPLGARKLAENEHSLHAFRKDDAFGVQFHPEYDFEMAKAIVEEHADEDERTEDARESLTRENYETAREATAVFDDFSSYVRRQA